MAAEIFRVHGLHLSEDEVAAALEETSTGGTRGEAGRSVFGRFAQGRSSTSSRAHEASQLAFDASAQARADGSKMAQGKAASLHLTACRAHDVAAKYHERAAGWHDNQVRGETSEPEPLDDE